MVVGAGPYALSTAALAQSRGIETLVVGRSMEFWRKHMPEGMFLRSGSDWHLDAEQVHTLDSYLQERGIAADEVDPIPVDLFIDYAEWFRQAKRIDVDDDYLTDLTASNGGYEATLASGGRLVADAVVCAPGISHFTNIPGWGASAPAGRATHTCNLVSFEEFAGLRVLIVGGRQSAYEWAALLREHGAERIDIVHRHDVPRFERVSWKFVDEHVENTIKLPGYWRNLPKSQQDAIAKRFWEVGRMTLEYWLAPRLAYEEIHRWPQTEVAEITPAASNGELRVLLSTTDRLAVDRVVFASGYRAQLERIPYLSSLLDRIERSNGFPVLDEAFGTSLAGLYVTGFSATQDFGPFFGFVKAAPAAATLIVRDLLARR